MTSDAVVTMRIPAREIAQVQVVMRLIEDDCLPAELHFDAAAGRYEIEISGDRAAHVLDLIDLGASTRGSESFSERLVRLSMQQQLPFHEPR